MDSFRKFRRCCTTSLVGLGLVGLLLGATGCAKKSGDGNGSKGIAGLAIHHASASEGDGKVTFRITANPPLNYDVQIQYSTLSPATSAVVANAGVDYTAVSGKSFTLTAGTAETFVNIAVTNDNIYERNEVFGVSITAPKDVNVGQAQAQGTIVNDDAAPIVSMSLAQGNLNTTEDGNALLFDVTINGASEVDSEVLLKNSDPTFGDKAHFRVDYLFEWEGERLYPSSTITEVMSLTFPASSQASRTSQLKLLIVDDGVVENVEAANIFLSKSNDDAQVANGSSVVLEITDNDADTRTVARAMNDTGLLSNNPNGTSNIQDSDFGADAAAGGKAFDFTVYDATGQVITNPLTQTAHCVKDNTTGLVWEVHENSVLADGTTLSLRHSKRRKYWHDPDANRNGGNAGRKGEYRCDIGDSSVLYACNTAYYAADVNAAKVCGLTGWRLPTVDELQSLIDYGRDVSYTGNTVISSLFPDGEGGEALSPSDHAITEAKKGYWTSNTDAITPDGEAAWYVRFALNGNYPYPQDWVDLKSNLQYVRLVTEQQPAP